MYSADVCSIYGVACWLQRVAADGMMPTPGSFEHKLMMRRLRKEAEVLKNELSHEQASLHAMLPAEMLVDP